ncbi:hypothetical protein BED46_023995 [Burkholderia contaminans]|nr:hypothetical protein BED46_023995 [Burkholderia contaminans]
MNSKRNIEPNHVTLIGASASAKNAFNVPAICAVRSLSAACSAGPSCSIFSSTASAAAIASGYWQNVPPNAVRSAAGNEWSP